MICNDFSTVSIIINIWLIKLAGGGGVAYLKKLVPSQGFVT